MDFALTPEQAMLQDSVRRFVSDQHSFDQRQKLHAAGKSFLREHWAQFAELGWLGAAMSEDAGGLGGSEIEAAIILEEFGRGLVGTPFLTTAILCAGLVESCADYADRIALLERIIGGETLIALAYQEHPTYYDPSEIETTSRPSPSGVVLNGRKIVVLDGDSADLLIVSARLFGAAGERGGIALYLVPTDASGVTVHGYRTIDHRRAADVTLHDVIVPEAACLAGAEHGYDRLTAALDRAAALSGAEALGAIDAAIALTADYAKTRQQFGRPIGQFQVLQHRLSDMFVTAQNARSMVYRALSMLGAPDSVRARAVSATKVAITDAAAFVAGQAIQLHGGIGMTEEYAVGHYYKRLQVLGKTFGDASYHLERYLAAMDVPEGSNR